MPRAGEVVLIPFPFTDLASTKRRPVLAIRHSDPLGDFLAVAITSQPGHADGIPIGPADFSHGTLPKPSFVRATKVYTLNERIVAHGFGSLTAEAFQKIRASICTSIGCTP